MSDEILFFFKKNLSLTAFGIVTSSVLSFLFNYFVAKQFGPSGYGTFVIIQSIAMFFYIPMLLGYHSALIKYISEYKDLEQQKQTITFIYLIVILFSSLSCLILYIFSENLAEIFNVNPNIISLSIIFATIFSFYTLSGSTVISLKKFYIYAILQVLYGLILILILYVLLSLKIEDYLKIVIPILISYFLITLIVIFILYKNYFKLKFYLVDYKNIIYYSFFGILGGLSNVFYTNMDKILINNYMGITDVGIYAVYSMTALTFITLSIGIFVTVFFPFASSYQEKHLIFHKFKKISPILFFLVPIIIILQFILLNFYGSQYPFNLVLSFLFAIFGIIICIDKLFGQLLNSMGIIGVKTTSVSAAILALSSIILNFLLIPNFGYYGAVIALIFAYCGSIMINFLRLNSILLSNNVNN